MSAATIIAQATPELPEVTRWEVWGPLGVMLAVLVVIVLTWFFSVLIPERKRSQLRADRMADAQMRALQASSDTGRALSKAYDQQTLLLREIRADHGEFRAEVGSLFEGVKKDIGTLHGRIDRLYERRSDGSIDCVRDD